MAKIVYFYLERCPHCKNADRMFAELIEKNPEYAQVEIAKVEEKQNALYATKYDYFYVPAFYVNERKIHEGVPTMEIVENALKTALAEDYFRKALRS